MALDSLAAVVAIHLEHRLDRRQSILKQIDCLDVAKESCYLLNAIFHPFHGNLGCAESHIHALEFALSLGVDNVLILEDDFIWLEQQDTIHAVFQDFLTTFSHQWDVFFFSTHVRESQTTKSPRFIQVTSSLCAHAYLVRHAYIATLLDCFRQAALAMQHDENHLQSFFKSIDRAWSILQQKDRWYAPIITLGCQGSFTSDISFNHRNRIPVQ